MKRLSFFILLAIAVIFGLLIAWVDSRPTWDDTGITVGVILIVTALLGFASPRRAWLWALAVGIWPPLFALLMHNSLGALIALVVAFIGAYAGALIRRALSGADGTSG
jgi:hypothetical protein